VAEQCSLSPRNQYPCVLPWTWEAHRAGHFTGTEVERYQQSHWPTTPDERAAMQKVETHG
jgi:hypothetical protein